jgi:hypothetical protein
MTPLPPQPALFSRPAPSVVAAESGTSSVLNPFSVYEKGEALLRKQLSALSAWHLVNIAVAYELSPEGVDALNRLPAPALIELIVNGVRRARVPAGRQQR